MARLVAQPNGITRASGVSARLASKTCRANAKLMAIGEQPGAAGQLKGAVQADTVEHGHQVGAHGAREAGGLFGRAQRLVDAAARAKGGRSGGDGQVHLVSAWGAGSRR
jgi:hypothetical protein